MEKINIKKNESQYTQVDYSVHLPFTPLQKQDIAVSFHVDVLPAVGFGCGRMRSGGGSEMGLLCLFGGAGGKRA